MSLWIVDRLDGEFVVCEREDGSLCPVPLSRFEGPVREGDCLKEDQGRFSVDQAATKARREQLKSRISHIWKRNPPSEG